MINTAIEAAKKAGELILEKRKEIEDVKTKDDKTLVTDIDLKSQDVIVKIIKEKYPDHQFYTEETGEEEKEREYEWAIDPIDGTHNYLYGLPMFGVSIALLKNKEPIIGVIYLPLLDKMFTAEKGKGAFLNGEKIHIAERELKDSMIAFGGWWITLDPKEGTRILQQIIEKVFEIRIIGSNSYILSHIAEGGFDAFMTPEAKIYDAAAGVVICQEAGAVITDFEGNEFTKESKTLVVANKKNHESFLTLIT